MKTSVIKKFPLFAALFSLVLGSCLNPIGLPSYGSTQGSTGGGDIAPGDGRLIIKNLTREFNINRVSFAPLSGQDSAPALEPGPEKSNQRSVALPAGLWKITVIYGPMGKTVSINDVMISEGSAATVYFYQNTSGNGSLETQWLPPPDADLSGNSNPGDVLSEDEGFLHVINKSALSYITGVEYNNGASWIQVAIPAPAGMSGNIAPGQSSSPDLVLPRGSWAIRFRLLGKDVPSVAVSRTIIAGQNVTIEYTDSLITDRPPSGFGSLRIVNNLADRPITKIITRTQVNNYAPEELALSASIPQGGGSQVRALFAGGAPGSRRDYIVQCYVAANEYYEEVARIVDETITDIFITENSSKTTDGGGGNGGGSGSSNGSLTVYNRYAGQLPFKIFKIYLYPETGPGAFGDGYVPPTDEQNYPKAPSSGNLHYNGGAGYTGDYFVSKGDFHAFAPDSIPEGVYKMLIVGGSFHWLYYTASPPHVASGIRINERRITYDCGNIFIAGGGKRTYNFDPYMSGFNDRDTPSGAVRINFHNAGTGGEGPLGRIQIVAASENATPDYTAGAAAYVYNVVQSNQTTKAPQASITPLSHGGETHHLKDGSIPPRFVVYDYSRLLHAGNSIEFYLPPGVYAVRVLYPQGDGLTPHLWFGRDKRDYFDLHIKEEASHTIDLEWKYPAVTAQSANFVRSNVWTVNLDDFTGKLRPLTLYAGYNLRDMVVNGDATPLFTVVKYTWYYHAADSRTGLSPGALGEHYHIASYAPGGSWRDGFPYMVNLDDGKLYNNIGFPPQFHGPAALAGGYYSLELVLEAASPYTFRGFRPSSDPPSDARNVNNQGTGLKFHDYRLGTNSVGDNNPTRTSYYRIRHQADFALEYVDWAAADGIITSTGELLPTDPYQHYAAGKSRIRVRIHFKQVP
ncbi:MAG: hypothetical protein LBC88_00270 [Spirochaetaceae bacterium]|jgi:hypothetical protein|nr:hypothetical protein [Spirochaetaceae bacterium]